MDDEVIRGATVAKGGLITWPPPTPKLSKQPKKAPAKKKAPEESAEEKAAAEALAAKKATSRFINGAVIAGIALLLVGSVAPPDFMSHFTVFVLACFVGYQVVWNVTPSLHTPLMSVTNAISSVIIVGALLQISSVSGAVVFLAAVATLITSINIAGGFAVTERMLKMFRKD